MKVEDPDYTVTYSRERGLIEFVGALRMPHAEHYKPIVEMLQAATSAGTSSLTLDFRQLRMLNSRGFGIIAKFVLGLARAKSELKVVVLGSKRFHWQARSLVTLQRLWSSVEIQLGD
jgi:hypothetical protein